MLRKLILTLILFFVLIKPVYADLLPAGQVIDSDYYKSGETVQINGDIHGDAFLIGGIVTINGNIDGDLFIVGAKVNVNGNVGNSVRIVAGDVNINSIVKRNVLLVCANCTITKQTAIDGSLLVGGANLEVSAGKIGRGFRFFGNRLFLNSEINNEAFVVADKEFLLGPKASISSDLKYTGNNQAVLESGATIAGHISYQKTSVEENYPKFFGARQMLSSYKRIKPVTDFLSFGVSALIGFILLGLFPKIFEKTAMAVENRPAASFGWGAIILLALPVVVVLFAITIIGIPISLVLLLLTYIFWILAQYLMAFFIGRKIMISRFGERRGWALVLGLFLIYILGTIPVLGTLSKIILTMFALGAAVLAYKQPVIVKEKRRKLK